MRSYRKENNMKTDLKKKFTSRKFIAMLTGVATGVAVICTGNVIEGVVAVLASVVTYICAEANIDAKAIKNALEGVADKIDDNSDDESNVIGF